MTMRIDQAELDNVRDVTQAIVDTVAPTILKCITAAQPVRDYRKEAWLVGFADPQNWMDSDKFADKTLAEFDKRFPK